MNSIDTVEAEGIKKTVLLSSSANARTIATPALISGRENSVEPENDKFKKQHVPVSRAFRGQISVALLKPCFCCDAGQPAGSMVLYFSGENSSPNKMIIVADGDIVLNSVIKGNQPIPMGMNPYTYGTQREFPFANKDFLQNCLEYLVNQDDLGEAKSKDYVVRLLDSRKTADEKTTWQVINILVPVILVLIFAFIYQWIRKRRYTK